MTSEILFLSHRIPFPPDRGDKIRSHHILKRLAQIAPVHVATFADDDSDAIEEAELASLSASHCLVRRNLPLMIAGLQSLLRRQPVSLPAFHSAALDAYIKRVLAERPIGTIYVFSGQMGQYVPESFTGRVIVDFVDVDSAKFDAYAAKQRGPMRWINDREGRLLRREELRLALRADHSLLISAEEAALFASRLPPQHQDTVAVSVLGNGIDSDHFNPDRVVPALELAGLPLGRMIFTGQMDYPPNIDAVSRLARRILPRVQDQLPDASLHIVGRNPTDEVLALADLPGCEVWGRVDDMRCWLAGADLAVVPLEIARGVQNKVLEAMAMRLPVVLSSGAATGIPATDGQDFLIADSDGDLACRIVGLIKNPNRAAAIAAAARHFVVDRQSWNAALAPLDGLIAPADAACLRHAA
jgi:polysaccharide biosynthesis protein PslH